MTTDPAATAAAEGKIVTTLDLIEARYALGLSTHEDVGWLLNDRVNREAEVRERIAADIEAEARQVLTDDGAGQVERAALLDAARIARGVRHDPSATTDSPTLEKP